MSESSALQWLRAPKLAEDALPEDSRAVACRRCGRTVQVSLSPMRPPSFLRVEDQVECPEVQERWTGKSEGGLLLMMCGALEQSLDAEWEIAEPESAARREPAAISPVRPRPSLAPAASLPDRWDDGGDDDQEETGEGGRLKALFAPAAGARKKLIRGALGVVVLGIVFLGGVLLPLREIGLLIQAPPGSAGSSSSQREAQSAAPLPSPRRILLEPASTPQDASRSPSSAFIAPRQAAPPLEATLARSSDTAAISRPAPAPEAESKLRVPELVAIAGGSFAMGGDDESEQPAHQVSVRPFSLGKYPVTIGEWRQCVAAASCADIAIGADDRPVTNLSYDDTQAYLGWLSKATGKSYRLPTEAEWEYAARGGQRTRYWWGDRMRPGMASCRGCNGAGEAETDQPPKIGSVQANPYGLFDMGGGIGQWVADNWHKNYKGAPADGSAWLEESSYARVIRSGSWKNGAADARAGSRDRYDGRIRHPTLGFRVALSP
ncbi:MULTISPECIES: formylglycine-generating enzyme family protein [unclassified Bradyrhizobium]|uniref:formylglycine-generating enzyme family protein n=1 Tax=unclassified Bradyrhizobium TaxID=2631580 RepID=UPI0028E6BB40|nr:MULTISPECIES: formylglycine-generating enzyme family protein [unclassified Bradyrhizobium]